METARRRVETNVNLSAAFRGKDGLRMKLPWQWKSVFDVQRQGRLKVVPLAS